MKTSGFISLAALVIVVLIGICTIVLLKNPSFVTKQPIYPPATIPILTPIPAPNDNLTLNWRTYRNEKFGIELKYPKEFLISPADSELSLYSPVYSCMTDAYGTRTKIDASEIKFVIIKRTGKNYREVWKEAFGFDFNGKSDGTLKINNKQAYFFYQGAEMPFGRRALLVEANGRIFYEINIYTPLLIHDCEDKLNHYPEITDQVLSTFKFIDVN